MKTNEIYKTYGRDYKQMTKDLLAVSSLADRIPADAHVGIKPNLVSPTPAEYGATTHPEIVTGIIEYLKEHGYSDISILESSWIGDKTSEAYEYCGYRQICEQYEIPFIDLQKEKATVCDCCGMDIKICEYVKKIDFLINVPVMKGHGQTKITCALKNLKGLIPNVEKRHFHSMGLHKPIAHLSSKIQQDFIVVDHICGDLELEDGGNPIETNCIMTALDPVLLDSYVCHMLGYEAKEVQYIPLAASLGSGSMDLGKCEVTIFKNQDIIKSFCALDVDLFEDRRCPSENLLDISYAIEDADSCSACYASLAPALLRLKEDGLYDVLLEKLDGKISIGQGFSGEKGYFGVGNCCRAFEISVAGCPPDEEDVYQAFIDFVYSSTD